MTKCFVKGTASPYNSRRPQRKFSVTVHGDEFTSVGPKKQLEWMKEFLADTRECKHHFLGFDKFEERYVTILGRATSWDNDGI